jgi:N-acetylmuramic acid 6-phosphate etherase
MSVPASIRLMLEEDAEIPVALMREHRKIHRAIQFIVKAFTSGGRLFYVGAGTSGRLGVLDAYECPPTFNVPPGMVQAILAGSDQALKGAMEDAEDDIAGGTEAVRSRGITKQDVVIGIAASGRTPFVWGALNAARDRGAVTILVCFNPNLTYPAGIRPDLVITPRIGPEVLTGSTRLKAGTATKLLLNMFTTLSMVRIGKVVENLMVDVQPTNAKLRLRAIRIVRELAGVTAGVAEDELKRNDWAVKTTLSRLRGGSA